MSSKKEVFLRRKISKSEKRFPRHLKYLAAMEGGSWGYNLLGALFGRMTLIWFGRCSIGWNRHAPYPFVSIYRNFCSIRTWISHHFYEIGPPCNWKKRLHYGYISQNARESERLHYGYITVTLFFFGIFPVLMERLHTVTLLADKIEKIFFILLTKNVTVY